MQKKLFLSMTVLLGTLTGLVACQSANSSSVSESSSLSSNLSFESSSSISESASESTSEIGLAEKYNCISVERALELAGTEKDYVTEDSYYVYGVISSIDNPTYGQMTITDNGFSISVYGTFGKDNVSYSELENKPVAGDEIVLYGKIGYYNSPEMKKSEIIEFIHHEPEVDETYKEMTVSQAREAEKGTNVIVEGVVTKITYAFGKVPNGFYLIDDTSSIYVYDNQLAPLITAGNKIKIGATKDYYINPDEAGFAQTYGYKGSCQLTKALLLENDKQTTNQYATSWIQETTIKSLMEKANNENFTNLIYKVNAIINKVPGTGFVNYYINDLDDKTGSYVYTMCNGSDFDYLDAYDGKLVTMYLTVINSKSTNSGCLKRLMPIDVIGDYTFDLNNTPKFVVDYYGVDQFKTTYNSDPAVELITSVSSTKLGFENAVLSYESSNEEIAYFEKTADKVIFHTKSYGEATITIKSTYNQKDYSQNITITVEKPVEYTTITVKEAIQTELQQEVTVKGVAGPSLINKSGFYLIDDTGSIAVLVDSSTMSNISLGDEVILKGVRSNYNPKEEGMAGQCIIDQCQLLLNNYGKHDYSTSSFIEGKTLTELSQIPVSEDVTSNIYVIDAKITKVSSQYYTNYYVESEGTKVTLYNNGDLYSWLTPYIDQTVTIEFALCNWNSKNPYKGAVLAIRSESGKVVNTVNYDKK